MPLRYLCFGPPSLQQRLLAGPGDECVDLRLEAIGPGNERLRIATAHDAREIEAANAIRADAVALSPVFATRTHPDAATLGPLRFRALAALARMPVIALGGMTTERAAELDWPRWAAIDGLARDNGPTQDS